MKKKNFSGVAAGIFLIHETARRGLSRINNVRENEAFSARRGFLVPGDDAECPRAFSAFKI